MQKPWNHEELKHIIEDYFDMFIKEIRNTRYNKTKHRKILQSKLNSKTGGSIEYIHQNISAVLVLNDYPFIDGYKPASNFQAILEIFVLDHIERNKELLPILKKAHKIFRRIQMDQFSFPFDSIVTPPPAFVSKKKRTKTYKATKIDIALKEMKNKLLGQEGEKFIIQYEKRRLMSAGEKRLSTMVEWISKTKGDGLGYDILSFENDSKERFIEVKTTNFRIETPFYVTQNELDFSEDHYQRYYLYRVFDFVRRPHLYKLQGSLKERCLLTPTHYSAQVK